MQFAVALVLALVLGVGVNAMGDIKPPHWGQCDASWSNDTVGNCNFTICESDGTLVSLSMYMAARGYGGNAGTLNAWLRDNGGYDKDCNIIWENFSGFGIVTFQGIEKLNYDTACSGLDAGHGLLGNLKAKKRCVLLTSCTGYGMYRVEDPVDHTDSYNETEIKDFVVFH